MQQIVEFIKTRATSIVVVAAFLAITAGATAFAAQTTVVTVDDANDVTVQESDIAPLKKKCYGYGCDFISPVVQIITPNQSPLSGKVTITATAKDNVRVRQVNFYVDGKLIKIDRFAPYNFTGNTAKLSNGWHTVTAFAYDPIGNIGSDVRSYLVQNGCYGYGCPVQSPKR